MKTIASLAFLALVMASPVSVRAQEVQDDAIKKAVDAVQTERLELAKKINEVLPPARQIEQSLNQVADQWGLQEKDKFRREMMAEIDVAGIEQKSADTMAELFTKDELELMLAYYSSPLQAKGWGRAMSNVECQIELFPNKFFVVTRPVTTRLQHVQKSISEQL